MSFAPQQIVPSAIAADLTPQEMATLPFPVPMTGQNYAIISCVAPKGWGTLRTANTLAMRIYGTTETQEEAEIVIKRAKSLGYNFFDMHVVDITKGFIPLPPPADFDPAIPTTYEHPILNAIMKGHRDIINESSERLLDRMNATPQSKVLGGLTSAMKKLDSKMAAAPAAPEDHSGTVAEMKRVVSESKKEAGA